MSQARLLQGKLQRRCQHSQTILHAAAEVDGRRFFEIFGRARNFADAEAEVHALRQHLVVEDEVVGVFEQRQIQSGLAAEGAIAGVILRELDPQKQILKRGQKAVGDVFVERHAAAQRLPADDARSQHHVVNPIGHHAGHGRHQQRRVLIVGMHHDDHVRARGQRLAIAGLLVASVAVVLVMHKELQPQLGAISTVRSELWSSTRMRISTSSGSSATVASSVFSALYAGSTTAMRFPLIMDDHHNLTSARLGF